MLSEKSNRFNSKVKCQVYRSLSTQATQQFAHRVIVELASEKRLVQATELPVGF
jgi:hypothetical protein